MVLISATSELIDEQATHKLKQRTDCTTADGDGAVLLLEKCGEMPASSEIIAGEIMNR